MGGVVAEAGVNPADQRWGFWPLLPIGSQIRNQFLGLVPELSLICCATERECGLVLIRSLNGYQCGPRHHC